MDPIGMSAVSLGDPQSLNLYAYCGNDPVNNVDPDGLFFKKLFGWIGKALKWIAIAAAIAVAVISIAFPGAWIANLAIWASKHTILSAILGINTPKFAIINLVAISAKSGAIGLGAGAYLASTVGAITSLLAQKASVRDSSCKKTTNTLANLATWHWIVGNTYSLGVDLLAWAKRTNMLFLNKKYDRLAFDGFKEEYTGPANAQTGQKWAVYQHVFGAAGLTLIGERRLPQAFLGERIGINALNRQISQDWRDSQGYNNHDPIEGMQEVRDDLAGQRIGAYMDAYMRGLLNRNQLRAKIFNDLCAY